MKGEWRSRGRTLEAESGREELVLWLGGGWRGWCGRCKRRTDMYNVDGGVRAEGLR